MADNKPATVMEKKVKGTTYVVSSFFNTAAKETREENINTLNQ